MSQQSLIDFFIAEAEDHLNVLEKGIMNLEQNPSDSSGIDSLFRAAHTLKGSAALVKLNVISRIAHLMEDIFEEIKDGRRQTTPELASWMLRGIDGIKRLINIAKDGGKEDESVLTAFESSNPATAEALPVTEETEVAEDEEVIEVVAEEEQPRPVVEKRAAGRRKEDIETLESNFVRIKIDHVEHLMNLMGEMTIIKNYLNSQLAYVNDFRDEIDFAGRRLIDEVSRFSERYAYSIPDKADDKVKYIDPLLSEFHELEFDRYDELNLFARKLNEITEDINEALKSLSEFFDALTSKVQTMDRLITDSKEIISDARMVTVGRLYQRFTRAVRDISMQNGKKIKFLTSGYDTRIDNIIFERIFESLLHILRNSISHGIEPPEERLAKGKPEEGTIHLDTHREGNTVVIEISDDGRGIDFDRVRSTAIRKGIISGGDPVSNEDLLQLLFRAGFTTADGTDMTAGRGVGLDVVKETLAMINGTIEIQTEKDRGTTFRIKVPLSLIIINVVIFKSGGIEFIVPATLVQELGEIEVNQIADSDTFVLRDTTIPMKNLNTLLGLNDRTATRTRPVIVLNISGKLHGLVVDELIGQEDTIIKPFGRFLEGLKHFSGVSISADGRIRPVINPQAILDAHAVALDERPVEFPAEREDARETVLIVDDSLSVRKIAGMILQSRNYNVLTATNGLEALNIIDENRVDLVISDLEMPVMHGYELLNELRRRGMLNILPVVVLTSRSGERHKEKAFQLGASDFMVKPFDEETLIEKVRANIKSHHLT